MNTALRWLLAGSLALAVSVAGTASAYTLKTTPSGARVRWHRPTVQLDVVDVGAGGALSRAVVSSALRRAASAWAVPGAPSITVRERDAGEWGLDGVNGVYVLDRWPFPEPKLAVTVSRYSPATGELIEADILINGEMPLAVLDGERPDARYDLVLVLTHELGHVLGLDESGDAEATMWHRIGRGETDRRALSVDDVDGALALYPPGAPAMGGGCAAAPRGERARVLAPVALGIALAAARRRRRGKA